MSVDAMKQRWAATSAARTGETLAKGILVWDAQVNKLYIHDGVTAGGIAHSVGTTETASFEAPATITAAGNTTLTLGATDLRKTVSLTATGGAGAYTATVALSLTNATGGDTMRLMVALPASTNPTLEIRNATSGGTLLVTLHDTVGAAASFWAGEFVYNGTAWVYAGGSWQP